MNGVDVAAATGLGIGCSVDWTNPNYIQAPLGYPDIKFDASSWPRTLASGSYTLEFRFVADVSIVSHSAAWVKLNITP